MPASRKFCNKTRPNRTIRSVEPYRDRWMSRRLADHDYRKPGDYFVTICTLNRNCLFGEITGGVVSLSSPGKIAETAWKNLPTHFPSVALDAFIIMPDHIHGILILESDGPALGTVVGGFKSEVSRKVGRAVWQRYYYDRVIRNQKELRQMRMYIEANPIRWEQRRASPPPTS